MCSRCLPKRLGCFGAPLLLLLSACCWASLASVRSFAAKSRFVSDGDQPFRKYLPLRQGGALRWAGPALVAEYRCCSCCCCCRRWGARKKHAPAAGHGRERARVPCEGGKATGRQAGRQAGRLAGWLVGGCCRFGAVAAAAPGAAGGAPRSLSPLVAKAEVSAHEGRRANAKGGEFPHAQNARCSLFLSFFLSFFLSLFPAARRTTTTTHTRLCALLLSPSLSLSCLLLVRACTGACVCASVRACGIALFCRSRLGQLGS